MVALKIARYIKSDRIAVTTTAREVKLTPYDLANSGGTWQPKSLAAMTDMLKERTQVTDSLEAPTVIPGAKTVEGNYQLLHKQGTNWSSTANAYPGTGTPQGDPRRPIGAFGAQAAELLGIKVTTANGITRIGLPEAHALHKRVNDANIWLKTKGKPTFAYQLLDAGLIADNELAGLSLKTKKGSEIGFPFAVADPKLRGHEVSFHLGVLGLIDKSMGRRIRNVTQVFEDFANALDARKGTPAEKQERKRFSDAIRSVRSLELDVGTANGFTLAHNLLAGDETSRPRFNNAMQYLLHPDVTPGESLIRQLRVITGATTDLGLNASKLKRLAPDGSILKQAKTKIGDLDGAIWVDHLPIPSAATIKAIRQTLYELDGTFEANQRPGTFELTSKEQAARNVLAGLPERIALLNDALRATAGKILP